MCAVCVSPALEGWPILVLCGAGIQRREGQLTEALRAHHLSYHVLETVRGDSLDGWRSRLHRRAWELIRDQDLRGAIIIEDGARLRPGFVEFLASGGYLHADLTQFCYDRARVWRWGGYDASPGVTLRPLAASMGLASGYGLSRLGARQLLASAGNVPDAARAADADWPCDIARLDALVTRPQLVEPPDWLVEADPMPVTAPEAAAALTPRPANLPRHPDWNRLPGARLPRQAAGRVRDFAVSRLSRELSPGW